MSLPESVNLITKDREGVEEFKSILTVVANWMATPLMLLFWLADILYISELAPLFLLLRLTIIPVSMGCKFLMHKVVRTLNGFQWLSASYAFLVALPINIMIMIVPNVTTGYYAGLNLVAIGSLSFIPFDRKFLALTAFGIYAPYIITCAIRVNSGSDLEQVMVNSFFIVGSIVICFLIRFFHSNLRQKEFESRMKLHQEIKNRDVLIAKKTEEAIRLNALSSQFSPQIVRAIKEGRIDIETSVKRTSICSIFVDIVNSTEKVITLDQSEIDLVLSKFMDTVISTFLKYDLTIDKFQGDGILAFANEPIAYGDYVQRVCNAALEIKGLIAQDSLFYEQHWKGPLKLRMGIAQGEANVGFYGNRKFFKSYTAIGKPMVLAARLTNVAKEDQILFDRSVEQAIRNYEFNFNEIAEQILKGFGDEVHKVYELVGQSSNHRNYYLESAVCPKCPDSVLYLDTNSQGHFILRCRFCNYEASDIATARMKKHS